jgi:predicted nucleotidyltransferase component of viral defense system
MILRKEIAVMAAQKGVPGATIEKDWALGHFLDAVFSVMELRDKLVFKGGTCLRKCFLPDYRFSEDLDFTSEDQMFKLTGKHLSAISGLLNERTGMQTHLVSLRDLLYKDQLAGFEAVIKYWGADHSRNEVPPPPQRWQSKVKIEVILYESILYPISFREIEHPYSDALTENAKQIPCYSIEEILSEKMRSLVQRSYTAPRDLYDLWFLSGYYKDIDLNELAKSFKKKMSFKGYVFTDVEQLLSAENDKPLKASWNNSLRRQVPGGIPGYEAVKTEVMKWLNTVLVTNG